MAEQNKDSEVVNILCFIKTALPFDPIFSNKSICPRHPDLLKGSHQAADSVSAPREFHPSEDRSELPPLVATDHGIAPLQRSTLWPDRSIAPLSVIAIPGAARYL